MKKKIVIALLWLSFGYVAAGYDYSYFQHRFKLIADEDRVSDASFAVLLFVTGPIGLFVEYTSEWSSNGQPFHYGCTWDWIRAPKLKDNQ